MFKTLYLLRGVSEEAKAWIEEHVQYESYQMVGDGIGIEHRYIMRIVEGMREEGFEIGKDFEVV